MAHRRVVLICGPPGAGKTTYAHGLGLEVYDRDDDRWSSDREFDEALRRVARDRTAQAAVIRSGATPTARAAAAALCQATETIVLAVDQATCAARIRHRGREHHHREIAAVTTWWNNYAPDATTHPPAKPTRPPRRTGRSTTQRDRDRAIIRRAKPACHICGETINYELPHPHPKSFVVDHIIPVKHGGADRLWNKAAAHKDCNERKAARAAAPIVRRSGSLA